MLRNCNAGEWPKQAILYFFVLLMKKVDQSLDRSTAVA